MLAPNIAYSFALPKDVAGPTFEIVNRTVQLSTGLQFIELNELEVPKDRIFILSNVTVEANPGAAQIVQQISVELTTQTGLIIGIAEELPAAAAGQSFTLNWSGEIWNQGGGPEFRCLRFTSTYDLSAASNTMQCNYSGIIIPRGNAGAF